jgi:pilus assembly protein FimV
MTVLNQERAMQRKMAFSLWLAAGIFAVCQSAWALELGKLAVTSALEQPLRAQIELKGTSGEFTNLKARVASSKKYQEEGLVYLSALRGAKVTLHANSDGKHYLDVQSKLPMRTPYSDLLIEVTWPQGQTFREYTVLLDPPSGMRGVP